MDNSFQYDIDLIDKEFIERVQKVIDQGKRLDKAFDDFEMNVKLWEKEKTVFKMNNSSKKEEILSLWKEFVELDKETRI